MELQEQDIALLETYLAGELAGDDLLACERRLQAEPALAETLEMLRQMEDATGQTAKASLKQEMAVAKAAAVAAGMAPYQPSINPPSSGSFFGRLFKFLITLAMMGGAAWLVWKYVLHEQWPLQLESSSQTRSETIHTTRDTTIVRDTIRTNVKQ